MDFTMLPIDITLLCAQHECNQHASFEMVYVYCIPCNPCLFVCYLKLCSDWIHCCLYNFVWKCIFNWNCQCYLWCFSRNCTFDIFNLWSISSLEIICWDSFICIHEPCVKKLFKIERAFCNTFACYFYHLLLDKWHCNGFLHLHQNFRLVQFFEECINDICIRSNIGDIIVV